MPLSSEVVVNKPLSGRELAHVMLRDLEEVLNRSGMFSPYIAYGRVAYTIGIKMHLANPILPNHEVTVAAKRHPETPEIEGPPPLKDAPEESAVIDLERDRVIASPNAARIEAELPITVTVHEEGRLVTKELKYDKDLVPPQAPVVDRDKSDETARKWKAVPVKKGKR